MVKTVANLKGIRSSNKASRKMPPNSCVSAGNCTKKYNGGNSYYPRETPVWQKQITYFFPPTKYNGKSNVDSADQTASSSNLQ